MQGWICPGCKRCYSPFEPKCWECGPRPYTASTTAAPEPVECVCEFHGNHGHEWCGSSLWFEPCEECGGDGVVEDDSDPLWGVEYPLCNICAGACSFPVCASEGNWCKANPLPGREGYESGTPEWFVVGRPVLPPSEKEK